MAENHILPFAPTNTGSNLITQAEYEVDQHRLVGNQSGIARSPLVNKALKQSTAMASGLAQFLANRARGTDPDISDTLTPDEVAHYIDSVISRMTATAGSGLPEGGEAGQAIVMGENGPSWQYLSGIPLGQLTFLPYDDAPPGFMKLSYALETLLALDAFPDAVKLACPAAFNDEADFFYRADDVDGDVRNPEGQYLVLPAAARYFFRGFDADGGVGQYQYQAGQIEAHNHVQGMPAMNPESNYTGYGYSNDFRSRHHVASTGISSKGANLTSTSGGEETRPMNIAAFRVFIKLWDAATVPSNLDVQALVNHWSDLAASRSGIQYIDAMTAVLYPNGGSEGSPATVTTNKRYVLDNPFPGHYLYCEAQLFVNETWGETGWWTFFSGKSSTGRGVRASQYENNVVVQTGADMVIETSSIAGNPFGIYTGALQLISAPCRVIVTRLGKIAS